MSKIILGISCYYHDSGAALIRGQEILAAAQEERFTRLKHDENFPKHAVSYVLNEGGVSLSDLDAVVFYDKPLLKFERLLETHHDFAPFGFVSFLKSIPVWVKEKLFTRQLIWQELEKLNGGPFKKRPELLFPEHHISHAASAFYPSPFEDAAVVTIDGVGEWATTTICKGTGKQLEILKEIRFPHSLGLLYSAFTYYCGFKVNSGEYKLMGLAPYGIPDHERVRSFVEKIKRELIFIKEDGSFVLNMAYFSYATGLRMCNDRKWLDLFGLPRRESETDLSQAYMDLALAIQLVTEEVVLLLAKTAKEITGSKNLVLSGGVALNCIANGKILASGLFEKLWIQPAAGDAGGALGGALTAYHVYYDGDREIASDGSDAMKGSYLGPHYSRQDVERMNRRYQSVFTHYENRDELNQIVAQQLADGKVVGWFQGAMEFGPRALGNRSILGDPRNPEMQKTLNLKIKYREGFRPFAPSVLEEDAETYFKLQGHDSPYMLLVVPVQDDIRKSLPEDYFQRPLYDRLYVHRSELPAITHIDFSARVQTVSKKTNPRYWDLINTFKTLSGCSAVVNTSFNVRGEPIVCTPEDAYRCFMRTEMDVLVVEDFVYMKPEQPKFTDSGDWREEFELD